MSWERHEVGGRPLFVRAPADPSRRYPTVYVLHAHMRSATWWFNVEPFEVSYPERIEELAPDAVVVFVDGWTELGGGQWIGPLAAYLRDEVVPFVDGAYPTNGLRGLQGKSSGGYGAIVNALARPDLFHAVAAHAPDALFEVTLAHGFPQAARALQGSSLVEYWTSFAGLRSRSDAVVVELSAAAAAFGDGTLPFDELGRVDETAFGRWLEHDPVRLVPRHVEAVRGLRGVWLDAGNRDEYFLDLGALALREALLAAGLPEDRVHFELVEGGHGGMSHRYPLSLAWLVERLA
ncbi:MAG TPA: alpha/beta hydrolase-fold protein [Gaiellaceae bacterium]|nr:alpha/beta hydrolase-fold protein [Gaiellaceae bacterium]